MPKGRRHAKNYTGGGEAAAVAVGSSSAALAERRRRCLSCQMSLPVYYKGGDFCSDCRKIHGEARAALKKKQPLVPCILCARPSVVVVSDPSEPDQPHVCAECMKEEQAMRQTYKEGTYRSSPSSASSSQPAAWPSSSTSSSSTSSSGSSSSSSSSGPSSASFITPAGATIPAQFFPREHPVSAVVATSPTGRQTCGKCRVRPAQPNSRWCRECWIDLVTRKWCTVCGLYPAKYFAGEVDRINNFCESCHILEQRARGYSVSGAVSVRKKNHHRCTCVKKSED